MAVSHEFGGDWTSEKLSRVQKYIQAYTKIFASNPRAQRLHTIYLDAFAGTGYINASTGDTGCAQMLEGFIEEENQEFLAGSARIALEVEPPFKEYVFIEKDKAYANELVQLRNEFAIKRGPISVISEDANSYLMRWVQSTNWEKTRAVVFLDPYGMNVDWSVIDALGKTKAVDLWYLFPLGVAVNRLLTKSGPPSRNWARALTRIFGTDTWEGAFYPRQKVQTLFGEEETQLKDADFEKIKQFFIERLKTAFTSVSTKPLDLRNSKNNPLYLLCFAASNPKGAPTALKIADFILKP